jgi:hypothetical protein
MKKLIVAVLALLSVAGSLSAGELGSVSSELCVDAKYWIPGTSKFDLYSMGYGAEVQYRYWFYEPFGAAVSLGAVSYDVDDSSDVFHPLAVKSSTMTFLPIGVSGLFRIWDGGTWSVSFDAGVRYIKNLSDLEFADGRKGSVDDSFASVIGLRFNVNLTESLSLFGTVEHLDDITKGEVDGPAPSMVNNELQGLALAAGASFMF